MKRAFTFAFLALIAGGGLFAGAAHADPHGWRNGGPKYNHHDNRYKQRDYRHSYKYKQPRAVIHNRDRVIIGNYIGRTWRPMPASYTPRYLIGAPLAYGVPYHAVPRDVLVRLAPVPYGYRYVRVDDDVLLLDAAAIVIDAVIRLNR